MKLFQIINVLILVIVTTLVCTAQAFQSIPKLVTSSRIDIDITSNCKSSSTVTYAPTTYSTRATLSPVKSSCPPLHLFDNNRGPAWGSVGGPGMPPGIGKGKPKDWKDGLQRLKLVITTTASQFMSAYISGYLLGAIWGFLRGRATRAVLWGLELGSISAIFGGCSMAGKVLFDANEDSVWSSVVRNCVLAVFFSRNSTILGMIQNVAMYGGLTYYFVSQQKKRQASLMDKLGGASGTSSFSGRTPPGTMEEFLQRMSQTSVPSSKPSTKPTVEDVKKANPPKADVVDVEWEAVNFAKDDNDEEDDNSR